MNPDQRVSSAQHAPGRCALSGRDGSVLQLVIISIRKPTRRHPRATGAHDTTRLYYTPIGYLGPEVRRLSSSRSSHIVVESIRRTSRTVHQSPITMIPDPQVRILILIDIGPMIRANLPVIATMSLHATTIKPTRIQKATNVMRARRGPIIAIFVAERTP